VGRPALFDEEFHPELHDMRHTIAFMEENRDDPWFIQCSFRKPHPPFLPPQRQWNRIDRSSLAIPCYPDDDLDDVNPILWRSPNGASRASELDDEIVLDAMQGYYASLAYCDELFGQVIGVLDHLDLREDTLVVFTSDHGEMLYEHRLWSKSNFFEQSVHVPLILSWPGRLEAGTSDALAEHIDLFPTFMDLAGLETPESVQGRSLSPVLEGAMESNRDLVHSERRGGIAMQFDGRWKFIHNGEGVQHELYDLQEDPREIANLAINAEYRDRVQELEAELSDWKEEDAVPRRPAGGGTGGRRGRRGRGRG
jgi:choline-sulfatase